MSQKYNYSIAKYIALLFVVFVIGSLYLIQLDDFPKDNFLRTNKAFVMPEWCSLSFEESYDSDIEGYETFMELTAQYEERRKELYSSYDRKNRLEADTDVKEQYVAAARELMNRWDFDLEGTDKKRLLDNLEENVRLYGQAFYILKRWKTGEILSTEYYEKCEDIYLIYQVKGTYEPLYFHMMEMICPELYTTEIDKWVKTIPDPATDSDGWSEQMAKYRELYCICCGIESVLQYIPDASSKRDEIAEVKKTIHLAWSKATDELIAENNKILENEKKKAAEKAAAEKALASSSSESKGEVSGSTSGGVRIPITGSSSTTTSTGSSSTTTTKPQPPKKPLDPYDVYDYDDPYEFADDWAEEFLYDEGFYDDIEPAYDYNDAYDDAWNFAYDYWWRKVKGKRY